MCVLFKSRLWLWLNWNKKKQNKQVWFEEEEEHTCKLQCKLIRLIKCEKKVRKGRKKGRQVDREKKERNIKLFLLIKKEKGEQQTSRLDRDWSRLDLDFERQKKSNLKKKKGRKEMWFVCKEKRIELAKKEKEQSKREIGLIEVMDENCAKTGKEGEEQKGYNSSVDSDDCCC